LKIRTAKIGLYPYKKKERIFLMEGGSSGIGKMRNGEIVRLTPFENLNGNCFDIQKEEHSNVQV